MREIWPILSLLVPVAFIASLSLSINANRFLFKQNLLVIQLDSKLTFLYQKLIQDFIALPLQSVLAYVPKCSMFVNFTSTETISAH